MTDEINNPSHEGRWHEGLGRKLTEHELDMEDLTDWQESQTTQNGLCGKVVADSGTVTAHPLASRGKTTPTPKSSGTLE